MSLIETVDKEYGFSFAENTTYGLGGTARVAYFPKSFNQATAVYDYLSAGNVCFMVLGNGSDILASDSGYDGAVICTCNLKGVFRKSRDTIFCRAGTHVAALLKWCLSNGVGGLEFLYGIPATVGGLTFMNGGVAAKHIGDFIKKVTFYDGKKRILTQKECNFGNKYSTMRDINGLILGVELEIEHKSFENIMQDISAYKAARIIQPKGKSCGCVFKNHNGVSAGKIIDECGLKGLKIGSAEVSSEHANFIINNGSSSADIYKLIAEVKKRVFASTGISLEEEVVYIGDFNDTFS